MQRRAHPLIVFIGGCALAFLLFPLLVMVLSSLDNREFMSFPPQGLTLRWYGHVLGIEMLMSALRTSAILAISATFLALIIGLPGAYVISRFRFPGRELLNSVLMSPIIIPQIVLSMAFLQYLVIENGLSIRGSLLLGHTLILLPYVLRVVGASLGNLPISIDEASLSLGANGFTTFFKIILPNIQTGILATIMLAFITSFNNVPMSLFLTGPGVSTLPIQMIIYSEHNFDPSISALSVLLLLITFILVFLMEKTIGLTYFSSGSVKK